MAKKYTCPNCNIDHKVLSDSEIELFYYNSLPSLSMPDWFKILCNICNSNFLLKFEDLEDE